MHARPLSAILSLAVVGLGLTAGAVSAQSSTNTASLYQRIGGYDVVARVVDDFLTRFDADPQLMPFLGGINASAGARIRQHFIDFICARTGGPCLYHGKDMKVTHEGLPITAAHFAAVIRHFDAALGAQGVREGDKQELLTMLRGLRSEIVR